MLQAATDRPAVPRAIERWLTVCEVAERLCVSTATVYALCKRGQLRHIRVANAIPIAEEALPDVGGSARGQRRAQDILQQGLPSLLIGGSGACRGVQDEVRFAQGEWRLEDHAGGGRRKPARRACAMP